MTLSMLPPIIGPLLDGAGKLSERTQSGLVWAAKQFASDGGGVRISNHWGIAAENAERAWWGNGPLKKAVVESLAKTQNWRRLEPLSPVARSSLSSPRP